jgi:predicted transcriptional regulator
MNDSQLLDFEEANLPPQVQSLSRRERELASVVYRVGPVTAKALEQQLSKKVSNTAVRTMLGRLCDKGILKRRKHRTGSPEARRIAFLYMPALAPENVRQKAVEQLAHDYFDGSLRELAQATIELLAEAPPARSRARR